MNNNPYLPGTPAYDAWPVAYEYPRGWGIGLEISDANTIGITDPFYDELQKLINDSSLTKAEVDRKIADLKARRAAYFSQSKVLQEPNNLSAWLWPAVALLALIGLVVFFVRQNEMKAA